MWALDHGCNQPMLLNCSAISRLSHMTTFYGLTPELNLIFHFVSTWHVLIYDIRPVHDFATQPDPTPACDLAHAFASPSSLVIHRYLTRLIKPIMQVTKNAVTNVITNMRNKHTSIPSSIAIRPVKTNRYFKIKMSK